MGYRILNQDGEEVGGDGVLDDVVRAAAMLVGGTVVDDDGVEVYESTPHREHREREEQAAAEEAERLAGTEPEIPEE